MGIDPASSTGVCTLLPDDPLPHTWQGSLLDVAAHLDWITEQAERNGWDIRAHIERPAAGLHGAAGVRMAGALVEQALRERLPRRVKVEHVSPSTWQARARKLLGVKQIEPKELSRALVRTRGYQCEGQDETDAAAILIAMTERAV